MPTYAFACAKCRHVFTIERHMDARASTPPCPKCRSTATRQQFGAFYAKTIKKS